jgi:hypothetical protein
MLETFLNVRKKFSEVENVWRVCRLVDAPPPMKSTAR